MTQRPVEFKFKHFGCQGVHISTHTPSRLSDYTERVQIPAESGYHVVGCYLPFLISNMNCWNIVERYMEASERHPRTIIDVCLPYHDAKSRRTFLGRYIFFAGLLVGIRVNTNASEMVPNYSSWPKHKTKIIVFSMGKQEKEEILLGEFSLQLVNARVGLLFQSELRTSANEYMNYGYDILVLTYESIQPQNKLLAIKNELSKKAYVIQSLVGNFQNRIDCKKIGQISEKQSKVHKGIIYVDYFDLNKIFKLKQYISVSTKQTCQIVPITIDLMLNQQNNLKEVDKVSQNLLTRYSIASKAKQQLLSQKLSQDPSIDIFIKRLYKLYLLTDFTKIILIIEESPAILCFLYIVKNFINIVRKNNPNFQASQIFSIINLNNIRFNNIAEKFGLFESKHEQDSEQDCSDNLQIKILNHFNEIMQSQKNQEFFVVITPNQRILNIVKLLNQRQNINLKHHFNLNQSISESDSSLFVNKSQIVLKTWVGCDFFTPEELKEVYFGCTIKSVVEDRQYFGQLWLKYINIEAIFRKNNPKKIEEVIDLNLNEIEINGIFNLLNLSQMLKQSNLFIFQFQKLIAELQQRGCFGWQNGLFSHYLFRKINIITYFSQPDYVQKGSRNFIEQLGILQKHTLLPTFKLLTFYNFTLNDRLQHRLTLRKIDHIRQEHSSKQQCHNCLYFYPSSLIYQCKTLICREYFCYQCLIETKSIQPHELKKKGNPDQERNLVSRCPACKGLCDLGCKRCEIKSICCKMRKKEGVKTGRRECHFCLKQNAVNYYNCSNVDCKRFFCSKCIEEYYRDRSRECQNSEWHCYVCQERCNCNNCEVQKAAIRKVIVKIEMKKEIEKELDRTRVKDIPKGKGCEIAIDLIEKSIEQDRGLDASYIDVNEASTMLQKEFHLNLASSFGLAEQKMVAVAERSVIQIEEAEPALWKKGDLEKKGGKLGMKNAKQAENKKNKLLLKNKGQQTKESIGLESKALNKSMNKAIKLQPQLNRSAQLSQNQLQKSTISIKSTTNSASRPTKPSISPLTNKIKTKPLTFDFAQPLSGRQFDY